MAGYWWKLAANVVLRLAAGFYEFGYTFLHFKGKREIWGLLRFVLLFVWHWAVWAGVLITIELYEGLLFEGKRGKGKDGEGRGGRGNRFIRL